MEQELGTGEQEPLELEHGGCTWHNPTVLPAPTTTSTHGTATASHGLTKKQEGKGPFSAWRQLLQTCPYKQLCADTSSVGFGLLFVVVSGFVWFWV